MDTEALGIRARLVWDGGEVVAVPPEMGTPRADQLQGAARDRLGEVAGRVCYDSLGTGRDSYAYHQHIRDVANLSVYEHLTFTVRFNRGGPTIPLAFVNRPGVWLERETRRDLPAGWRATVNLRTVLEWNRHYPDWAEVNDYDGWGKVGETLRHWAFVVAPLAAGNLGMLQIDSELVPTDQLNAGEAWISLYCEGSRGFSHELVRHGDWTAISQRSTRYVDESEAEPVVNPLIEQFLGDPTLSDSMETFGLTAHCYAMLKDAWNKSALAYTYLAQQMDEWLVRRGVDKSAARKQARGAARGYLGNALPTALIFSASARQWRWILRQRGSALADAEIRAWACLALPELQRSGHGRFFADLALGPAPDGIGDVIVGWAD